MGAMKLETYLRTLQHVSLVLEKRFFFENVRLFCGFVDSFVEMLGFFGEMLDSSADIWG